MRYALFAIGLVACSTGVAPGEDTGDSRQAVIGGIPSTTDQDAVVLLVGPGYACSGTLVAPNLVLTARHCVSNFADEGILCDKDGTLVEGPQFTDDVPADKIGIYTGVMALRVAYNNESPNANGTQVIHAPGNILCNSDLAFVVLDRALGPVAPMRLTAPTVNEPLTLVGFGDVDNTGVVSFIRQQRTQTVLSVGPVTLDAKSMEGLGDSEFAVGESVCSGDSGGPMLSAKGEVVGVVSRGGGGMENIYEPSSACVGAMVQNVLTDLAHASALIDQAKAAANVAPVTAPAPTSTVTDPGAPEPGAIPPPTSSGGCSTSPGGNTEFGAWLAALLALAMIRRRRAGTLRTS